MNAVQSFDWKKAIKVNLVALRCVGLWPKGNEFYKFDSYGIYALTVVIVIIGGHNLSQIMNIFCVYNDLEALAATAFVGTTNLLAAAKMYFFVRNLKLIKQLFITLNSKQFRPKTIEQIDLVKPTLKTWRMVYFMYCTIVYTNVTLWSIAPVINSELSEHRLPFETWYPLDVKKSPNYQIVYSYQLICIWDITIANLNLDTIFFAVLMSIGAECDILCDDLRRLGNNSNFSHKLIECIKHHKEIVRFAKDSNNFFNMLIFGQIVTSTAVLALTMFSLSVEDPTSGDALGHLFYINGMTFQILFYCWYGNEIILKSSKIVYAAYECQWFAQSETVKKNIVIFCTRCQRPIKITALNLFTLSLETFIGILRSAWSYFALLNSVNSLEE